jgi:hypothetical protein
MKRRVQRAVSPPSSSLFSAPAPSQSRSRVYSHAHSQPIFHIRGRRSQSRSPSPWTTDESGIDDDESVINLNNPDSFLLNRDKKLSSTKIDYGITTDKVREPSHRRLHLQKVFDLLHLSISRKDGIRAFRCLRILVKSHEWRPIELWRYTLEVATLTAVDYSAVHDEATLEDDKRLLSRTDAERVAQRRWAFMQELSKVRTGLVSKGAMCIHMQIAGSLQCSHYTAIGHLY